MVETETIRGWVREAYNDAIAVYEYGDEYVRVTNGSAGHQVDIYPDDDSLEIEGEKYGEEINASCEADREELLSLLATTI